MWLQGRERKQSRARWLQEGREGRESREGGEGEGFPDIVMRGLQGRKTKRAKKGKQAEGCFYGHGVGIGDMGL